MEEAADLGNYLPPSFKTGSEQEQRKALRAAAEPGR